MCHLRAPNAKLWLLTSVKKDDNRVTCERPTRNFDYNAALNIFGLAFVNSIPRSSHL